MLYQNKPSIELNVHCKKQWEDQVPTFYRNFSCGYQYVSEALKDEFQYWDPRNPVILDAPPSQGKTTFIEEAILPYAISIGKNVLILVNRVGLADQLKRRVIKRLKSPLEGCLTDKGIRMTEHFGSVVIIPYHRLPGFLNAPENKEWVKNLYSVVADEIHFIVADSSFNENCSYYLKLLTTKFKHAIRIYLTATSWDVLYPLAEAEYFNYHDYTTVLGGWHPPREFRRYVFLRSFSNIDLKFFDSLDQIVSLILDNPNEKFVVFVDNKTKGRKFVEELNKFNEIAIYMDADSKNSQEWIALVNSETLQKQVLCSTSALDCGINIKDKELRNMVIISDDRTSMIQMLGRKRCMPDERFNVYIKDLSKQKIGKRYERARDLLEWFDKYQNADYQQRLTMATELWYSEESDLRKYFHLSKGYLHTNDLAFFKLKRKFHLYKQLNNNEVSFQEVVRGWLGMLQSTDVDYREQLLKYCMNKAGSVLMDSEKPEFRKLVLSAYLQCGFKEEQPSRTIQRTALNRRLALLGIPYQLSQGTWIFEYQE